jgi:UDP-glucose 4-epimerase
MMNVILLGAAGFIGTNLAMSLAKNKDINLTLVDAEKKYFPDIITANYSDIKIKESPFQMDTDFEQLLEKQDVVYHLVSTTVPTTSNQYITQELTANVVVTTKMLDACVKTGVKKVVFISSGGTVYGKESDCPLNEETPTYPISSYGVQKITIEKLLYLYHYLYDLDYRVIRLANPYGPFQRPNGILGAVTTFTYKALQHDKITVYGDGSVVRDFIYIEDAVRAIMNIVDGDSVHRTFNVGCGYGTSIKSLLNIIKETLHIDLEVEYVHGRKVDVPVNYLDISRYEKEYGKLNPISLESGILKTADFMKSVYFGK